MNEDLQNNFRFLIVNGTKIIHKDFSKFVKTKDLHKFLNVIQYADRRKIMIEAIGLPTQSMPDLIISIYQTYSNEFWMHMNNLNSEIITKQVNSIKKQFVIKKIENYKVDGNSFGINRYNSILNIMNEAVKKDSYHFIIDDPFDSLSRDLKLKLSKLIVELKGRNIEFTIFTNDIDSLKLLQENSDKPFDVGFIEYWRKTNNIFVSRLYSPNLFFMWNKKEYYNELKNIITDKTIGFTIANLLLSTHREIISDAIRVIEMTKIKKNEKFDVWFEKSRLIYDEMTKNLKDTDYISSEFIESNYPVIKPFYSNKISQLIPITQGQISEFHIGISWETNLFSRALAPFSFFIFVDSAMKELKNELEFIKKSYEVNAEQKKAIKRLNKDIAILQKRGQRNDLIHEKPLPLINSLMFDDFPEDQASIVAEYLNDPIWVYRFRDSLTKK